MAEVYHAGSFLKASIDGVNGSGKSQLCARIAIGISKTFYDSAPVVVADSEERWRIYQRTMFEPEGVPLVRMGGNTLIGVQRAIDSIKANGACVFVADQLTTPWKEGIKEFGYEDGYLPFDRRQQLMNLWMPFIKAFRYGSFHAICAGRLGYEWENLEDDSGRIRPTQGNSKFNAGGGENFGYEADLELEMFRNKRRLFGLIRGKTQYEYLCEVVKDAAAGILNGKQFVFPGQDGMYKPGDYKPVFEAFRPYLEFMSQVDAPNHPTGSTRELLHAGKTPWAKDQSERRKLLEELDSLFAYCLGSPQSTQGKMFRNLTLEYFGYSWSWSRMEEDAPTEELHRNLAVMRQLRKHTERKELPTDQVSLKNLLDISTEEVMHPGRDLTLLEVMGRKSVDNVRQMKAAESAGD